MVRRARIPATAPQFPTVGQASELGSTATPQLTRRTAVPSIRRVYDIPDDSVAVRWQPKTPAPDGITPGPAFHPVAPRQVELFRLPAVEGANKIGYPVAGDFTAMTLIVMNPLAAPIYFKFGGSVPSSTDYDAACPGEALMAYPIAGATRISAVVDYAGAVPATDANQQAVMSVSEAVMGPSVGPLNA